MAVINILNPMDKFPVRVILFDSYFKRKQKWTLLY